MQIRIRDNIPSDCSDTQPSLRYVTNCVYSFTSRVDVAPTIPSAYKTLSISIRNQIFLPIMYYDVGKEP